MFKKILVPVDLSDRHQQASEIAARLAKESDGEVTLLHVIEIIPGLHLGEERDFYQRLEQVALDHLTRLGRFLEEHQVPRREEIVYGHRAPEIVRYAIEAGIDLIVLSSHRIDPKDPAAGWGTVRRSAFYRSVRCSWSNNTRVLGRDDRSVICGEPWEDS